MKADAKTVSRLLKTARGQIDGILNMIVEDQYCVNISNQLMSCVAVLKRANTEVLAAHIKSCVREACESGEPGEADKKISELVELMGKTQ